MSIYETAHEAWWVTVPWYGIMTVVGTIAALIFIYYRWRQNSYSKFHFATMTTFGLLIALFGARWWYLAFHPSHYTGMIDLFQISEGRAIQGAIFFGGAFIWAYTKWIAPKLEFRKVSALIAPHVLLAQAIGRWGNFYNQEIYGAIVDFEQISWLPQFILDGMFIEGAYRNPLFLWESIANMTGWVILGFFLYDRKWLKDGALIGLYMLWYNTTRSIMEPMRDPEFIMNINGVPTTFIISITFATMGFLTFIYYQFDFYKIIASWMEFNSLEYKKLWARRYKLIFSLLTMKITYRQFTTLVGVSKNRYNKYIKSIDKDTIENFKESI